METGVSKKPAMAACKACKKPAATAPIIKRPAAGLMLGCSKCRYLKHGCKQCRNPNFNGRRGGPW